MNTAKLDIPILEEMKALGFNSSPGTLYQALHALLSERDVTVHEQIVRGKRRKCYRLTAKGKKELAEVRESLAMLMRKVFSPAPRSTLLLIKSTRGRFSR